MEKLLQLYEPKHYRYIISGILIYFINFTFFKYLSENLIYTDTWIKVFISSEFALLLSFPIHKYFTFSSKENNFFSELPHFLFYGHILLVVRFISFYGFFYISEDVNLNSLLSIFLMVLFNFAIFDRFVFNISAYSENISDPYGENGSGIETLETIEDAKNYNLWLCEKFEDYLGSKNLELGAGRGTLSAILSNKFSLELFEISEENHKYLKTRFQNNKGITKIDKDYLENSEWESYDCVYSSNVLEHIPDDEIFIIHGMKLLKPGGYFVAIVPAMKSLHSNFDKKIGHFRRYNKTDIKRIEMILLSSKINFQKLKSSYFNPVGAVGWFTKMKLLRIEKINKSDAMTMNALIPFISILDYLPLPFGQSMLIVLQKI